MNDFLFARSQMAMSLVFHIVFAAMGIGMPLLMAIAEGMYLRTKQPVYLDLCKRWAKGTAILVATANAWMNSPAGFKIVGGKITDVDPIAAILNRASFHEVLHMTLAAFVATGFLVAAVHAFFLLRDRENRFHRAALGIALAVGCVCTPLQILRGDLRPRTVPTLQPANFHAIEAPSRP